MCSIHFFELKIKPNIDHIAPLLKHTLNADKNCANANQWSLTLKMGLDWGASQSVGGGREEEVVLGDQGKGLSRVGNKAYLTKFISSYHWLKVKVNNMLDDFEHLFKWIIVSNLRNIFTLVDYYKKTWHSTWFLIR